MEKESKEGRENGGENDTNDTKEGKNTRTADNEVPEKCGVERDTKNGVDQNVADGIKTDACQGPEVLPGAEPHAERATRERSGKTDTEKEREPQTTDSSSKPNETNPKTVELKAGVTVEDVIKERPVSISVCTSAYDFNVKGLVSFLKDHKKDHPELIKEVKVHALPYNDLDHYKFPKENPVDVMLLCHSINNRRFAITDVMDALYDEYLPYCARVVGKNKMGVIVHDFDDMGETVQSSRMSSFRYKQPKAFETTSFQITWGHIEKKEKVLEQMQKADREKLLEFLKNASKFPEEMNVDPSLLKVATQGISSSKKNGKSSGSHQTHQTGVDERNLNPSRDKLPMEQQRPGISNLAAAAPTQSLSSPRRISISVCSSAIEKNVKGFISKLTELQTRQPHMIADVRFRSLPYNDIDSFRFPSIDPVDVMVLCHSVENRRFSITDVPNALYEKYLQYCHDVIGQKKLAVIAHDFRDCKPKILDVRRSQPLTFQLVDTVIVCGSLEKPGKIEMRDEDMTGLTMFFERARFEPKENTADKKSLVDTVLDVGVLKSNKPQKKEKMRRKKYAQFDKSCL